MHDGAFWHSAHFPVMIFLLASTVFLSAFAFWVWSIIDCARYETDSDNNKLIWLIVIGFGGVIGCLVYYFVRYRPRVRRV